MSRQILGDYDGTVLLVSHDRDFLDRVATTTIAMEGNGQAVVYAGGWTDYRDQRGGDFLEAKTASKPLAKKQKQAEKKAASGLTFTEKHRLEALPGVIEVMTAEIAKLEELLADPELFTQHPAKFQKATDALIARQNARSDAEEEWLMLEEKATG